MNQKKLQKLQQMGVQVWKKRTSKKAQDEIMPRKKAGVVTAQKTATIDDRVAAIKKMDWEELEITVKNCKACPLHKARTNTVFGIGNRKTDLLIVGEAPGMNEDLQGEPFVGRAGKLLNSMLHSIGLSREQIYIANVLKSRPPNNRDPSPEEVAACTPFLQRQIELIRPKLMVALGRVAAHFLLGTNETMGNLRGKELTYGTRNTPLIVTYHPAYLLRAPQEKAKAWDDLQRIVKLLKELGSKQI